MAHAEEATGRYRGELHGVQLWVAQPSETRDGEPGFEHHRELPRIELDAASATVVIGDLVGARSPARRDTDLVGVDLDVRGPGTVVPLEPGFEYGLVVLTGAVELDGLRILPGHLAYLGRGRDECGLATDQHCRALLLGGDSLP